MKYLRDMYKFDLSQSPEIRQSIVVRTRNTASILVLLIGLAVGFVPGGAWAIDLGSAKQQGLVGETPSGYLQAVGSQGSEVKQLVSSINAERKKVYQGIASKNKTTLPKVEALAGKKAIEKSAAGEYVLIGGSWKKK